MLDFDVMELGGILVETSIWTVSCRDGTFIDYCSEESDLKARRPGSRASS